MMTVTWSNADGRAADYDCSFSTEAMTSICRYYRGLNLPILFWGAPYYYYSVMGPKTGPYITQI